MKKPWKKRSIPVQQWLANRAVEDAEESRDEADSLSPRVQDTVHAHRRLLQENHFAERLVRAYK